MTEFGPTGCAKCAAALVLSVLTLQFVPIWRHLNFAAWVAKR
ncbi:MAG: hypothetical protein RBU25_10470 [Lentisphaeria bacterium]|nr:hypothetical protein [Lentisphaeria bacterium]